MAAFFPRNGPNNPQIRYSKEVQVLELVCGTDMSKPQRTFEEIVSYPFEKNMVQVLLSVTIGSSFFIVDVSLFLEELYETVGYRILFLLPVSEFQYDPVLPPSKVDVSVNVDDTGTDDDFSSLSSSLSIDAIVGGIGANFANGIAGNLLPPPDSPTISFDDCSEYSCRRCDN